MPQPCPHLTSDFCLENNWTIIFCCLSYWVVVICYTVTAN
jgi:hypothetical protein